MRRSIVTVLVSLTMACRIAAATPEEASYVLDAAGSEVFARLMPNQSLPLWLPHETLIAVTRIDGELLYRPSDQHACRFDIHLPVAKLEVDPPALRRRLQLPEGPAEEERERIRSIMLSEPLLHATEYPTIRFSGERCRPGSDPLVEGELQIRGHSLVMIVPVQIRLDDASLEVTGRFEITHETFGMKPYSDLVGAIRSTEEIEIQFDLRFVRRD